MPPMRTMPVPEPVEFSVEDVMLNTWIEDQGDYLQLDADSRTSDPASSDEA